MKNKIPTLFKIFDSFDCFTDIEIEYILSKFKLESYQKGTIILNFGHINDKLIYIQKGILREYSHKDQDQTITHWLMAENEFQYVADSFLEQIPSKVAIQIIENAKLWTISKQKLDELYEDLPPLNLVRSVMLEQNIIKYEAFIVALRQNKENRLEWFNKYHKDLVNRVPLKYIATYLNMSPQELSRVRSKMAKKK